jgi:hypothetical protein
MSDVGIEEVLSNRVKVRGDPKLSCHPPHPPPLPTGRQASRGRGINRIFIVREGRIRHEPLIIKAIKKVKIGSIFA